MLRPQWVGSGYLTKNCKAVISVIHHPSPYQQNFEFLAVASTFGTTTSYTVIIAGLTSWLFQHIWWAGCLIIADEDCHWLALLQVKVALTLVFSVAPILYRLSVYRLYQPKILVSAVGNITKCILVTKIYIFMGKLTIKLWNYVLKGKNLNKVVYQIGYRYRQIFLIHYRL